MNNYNRKMNILIGLNDTFVLPVKVMLKSLIINNPEFIHIFFVFSFLSDSTMADLKAFGCDRVKIDFIKLDDSIFKDIEVPPPNSKETLFRLLAHSYIDAAVDRLLWLDGDLIVRGPLWDFYSQDFDGKMFAAVRDMSAKIRAKRKKELRIPDEYEYVNDGVLLYNLSRIREVLADNSMIFDYIDNNRAIIDYSMVDQDIINGLFFDSIKVSYDNRYNYLVKTILLKNIYRGICLNSNYVLHYAGSIKPWEKNYHFLGFRQFWKYGLKFSEYKGLYNEIKCFRRAKWFKYKILKLVKGE